MKRFFVMMGISSAVTLFCFSNYHLRTTDLGYDHAFIADIVGNPPVMLTTQEPPGIPGMSDGPVPCMDVWARGEHQWTRPRNLAVINRLKPGDLIRRYHFEKVATLFGWEVWREHEDVYMPWRISTGRQLYPPPKWPLTLNDPRSAYIPFGSR